MVIVRNLWLTEEKTTHWTTAKPLELPAVEQSYCKFSVINQIPANNSMTKGLIEEGEITRFTFPIFLTTVNERQHFLSIYPH